MKSIVVKKILCSFLGCILGLSLLGNEGLWLPLQIKRLQGVDLQKMGLHLTSEEIYSINEASLKDAIVSFGGVCSGSIISPKGLLLTNYHCSLPNIEALSTISDNLFEQGKWAQNYQSELPVEGLEVQFLVRMENVTEQVLITINQNMPAKVRKDAIAKVIAGLEQKVTAQNHYQAEVKSFFGGREYYLFIYETYQDIRLVGAPPKNVGLFGGAKDNWQWPRHAGDFALYRIYTSPEGQPASFDINNVPMSSKYHLPISLGGIQEGDFTMIMGFPQSTSRFKSSYSTKTAYELENPQKIKINEHKLSLLNNYLDDNPGCSVFIQTDLAYIQNHLQYLRGQNLSLEQLAVIPRKEQIEQKLKDWYSNQDSASDQYSDMMGRLHKGYQSRSQYYLYSLYLTEGLFQSEILALSYQYSRLASLLKQKAPPSVIRDMVESLRLLNKEHFKNYKRELDRVMTSTMLNLFYENVPMEQHPELLEALHKKHKGNFNNWGLRLFERSIFADSSKLENFLSNPNYKTLVKDPSYAITRSVIMYYFGNIANPLKQAQGFIDQYEDAYTYAMSLANDTTDTYPDADGTLRVSFGNIMAPHDHEVNQPFQTTIEGLVHKLSLPSRYYQIPLNLQMLIQQQEFGTYKRGNTLPLAFTTTNDTSGGSSGSPVLNADGALIGLAFDGTWESLSNDLHYQESTQRSINVDIRYVLFIIDKYAKAAHLLAELSLVNTPNTPQSFPQRTFD